MSTETPVEAVAVSSETQAPASGPRCVYCGSTELRPSTRTGLTEGLLRLLGGSLQRCESCRRRFGFVVLGHPERHAHGPDGERKRRHSKHKPARSDERSRRLKRVLWTIGAAVLSFVLAAYMISRTERNQIEGHGVVMPPP